MMGWKKYTIFAAAVISILSMISLFWVVLERERVEIKEADELVDLPPPRTTGEMPVETAIAQRRSVRSYSEKPLTIEQVSQLLWSAQGITGPDGKRAAPSAGMTYPLELYVTVRSQGVDGLESGLYRYIPAEHRLEKIFSGDVHRELSDAAWGQGWVRDAPINVIVTAVYARTTRRYGERGRRYVHMEAGHVGQNLHLQSEALGLGMVVVGAFTDAEVQEVLRLPNDHEPLYIIPVGHPLR